MLLPENDPARHSEVSSGRTFLVTLGDVIKVFPSALSVCSCEFGGDLFGTWSGSGEWKGILSRWMIKNAFWKAHTVHSTLTTVEFHVGVKAKW